MSLEVTADGWTFTFKEHRWGAKRTGTHSFEEFGTPPRELAASLQDQAPIVLAQKLYDLKKDKAA